MHTPQNPITFSIIIPVLNEEQTLGETLVRLPRSPDLEVLVADGGSVDGTVALAEKFSGVRVISTPRGRGCQMNQGALAAQGQILIFLHADTWFTEAHLKAVQHAAAEPDFAAAAFELALRPPTAALRLIAWGANRRSRWLGLPYGDQVLILRRSLFLALGGYRHRRPEDLDLVLRLRSRARLRLLTPPVSSSGRRWLAGGYLRTTWRNWVTLGLHLAERVCTRRWPAQGDLAEVGEIRR